MLAVPVFVDEKVTWQLAVPTGLAPCESVHGLLVNDVPLPIPVCAKLTVPVGVVTAPDVVVSVTVAVHVLL